MRETLIGVAGCLNQLGGPWMIFGGAALALHEIGRSPVIDIDIALPTHAALRLSTLFGWKNYADGQSDRFRSDVILRPNFGPVPVELLGGFQVRGKVDWVTIDCSQAEGIPIGEHTVFVPTLERLADIFRLCGRAKDVARAELIDRHLLSEPNSLGN